MSHVQPTVRTLIVVFVALLLLLGLTVEAARHDLGRWNFIVATLIASTKAVLIVLYFMHVLESVPLTRVVVCVGFYLLAILFLFTFTDYWTRDLPASPNQSPLNGFQESRHDGR